MEVINHLKCYNKLIYLNTNASSRPDPVEDGRLGTTTNGGCFSQKRILERFSDRPDQPQMTQYTVWVIYLE